MNLFETFLLALTSLKNNKMRSFLTMLGIIIGISSVITITTIGSTIEKTIAKEFDSLGTNIVALYQYYIDDQGNYNFSSDEVYTFSEELIENFMTENPGFHLLKSTGGTTEMPFGTGTDTVTISNNAYNYGYYQFSKLKIICGRDLTKSDLDNGKYVAIVNKDFAKKLYGSPEKAIGNVFEYNVADIIELDYMIVGVYERSGSLNNAVNNAMGSNYEMVSSYNAYTKKFNDIINYDDSSYLMFYYDNTVVAKEAGNIVNNYFSKYITDPNIEIDIENPIEQINTFLGILTIITVAISFIAGIALIVGGVGVMNIMLVSVIERTKEIGIQKALGAKNNNIRFQFLLESVVICLIGCLIGVIIGLLNGYAITAAAGPIVKLAADVAIDFAYEAPWVAILIGCIFSSLIGVFFGLYPANKAAKLNPIDALRYE